MKKVYGDISGGQLVTDFKVVVADAEALIRATANQGDEKLAEIRAKAQESLEIAKARMEEIQADLMFKTGQVVKAADGYVHENPWQSIGVAASVGLVIGFLLHPH